MNSPSSQLSFRELLKNRAIKRLWLAQIVSIFGDFLAIFAVYSVVTFKMHGNANQVGMILVAYLLPLAIVSPIAGVYVDRWNVRWTMIASDVIRGVLVLELLFASDLYAIYAVLFLLSSVSAFFVPAQSVATRAIVPVAGLMAANALMAQVVPAMQIISPSIAGLLVQTAGANSCFLFDSFSFFFSAGMVFTIAIVREKPAAGQAVTSILSSMRQGMSFIFTHAAISFVVISIAAGMFAIRCFGALLSVYVRDILSSNAAMYGVLNSMVGIGMIGASQFMPGLARKHSARLLVICGLGGMGLAVLVMAALTTVPSTAACMLGLGFFAAFITIPSQTLIQKETPQAMLGRVSSSLMSVMTFSQVIAMLVAGPVAKSAGIRNLYYGSAAMLAIIVAIGAWQLRQRDEVGKPPEQASVAGA
jgi:MFS transporter, DHA3 family, macrolide efflux protein